jgi:hypothetical protein
MTMRQCSQCSEIAVWSVGYGTEPPDWTHYCYECAAERGLLDVPVDDFR